MMKVWDITGYIENNYVSAKSFVEGKTFEKYFLKTCEQYDICIFGTGALGVAVCKWLLQNGIIPRFFCDNNHGVVGKEICSGIECISFQELCERREETYIIVAVANKAEKHNEKINMQLKDFPNIMRNPLGISIYWEQDFKMGKEVLLSGVSKVMEILEDEASRILYADLWKLRMQNKVIDYDGLVLDEYYEEKQYIVEDLVDYRKIASYIDVGAFSGDSLADFIALGTNAEYYCFEMDDEIFEELEDVVEREYSEISNRIHLFRNGVSDCKKEVKYIADQTGSSRIDMEREAVKTAKAVALDDIPFDKKIDFIKMDIEGEEENALRGAVNLIKRDCPVLAISMYHSNEQFIAIPLLIKQINPSYHIYIRHHKYTMDDTVCYAINGGRGALDEISKTLGEGKYEIC